MAETYESKVVRVQAMRTAPYDGMVAAKDREEQSRLVAAWVVNNGGEVVDFGRTTFNIHTLEGNMLVSPGDWVIEGLMGEFYRCPHEVFVAKYQHVSQGSNVFERAKPDEIVLNITPAEPAPEHPIINEHPHFFGRSNPTDRHLA